MKFSKLSKFHAYLLIMPENANELYFILNLSIQTEKKYIERKTVMMTTYCQEDRSKGYSVLLILSCTSEIDLIICTCLYLRDTANYSYLPVPQRHRVLFIPACTSEIQQVMDACL